MRVFLSWSGTLSRAVAEHLHTWLPAVLQATKPYLSSEDIAKGSYWSQELTDSLTNSGAGLIIVTRENLERPWINFETGALCGKYSKPCVTPLLVDLTINEVPEGPLKSLNLSTLDRDDMRKTIAALNAKLGENQVYPNVLDLSFDNNWESFTSRLTSLVQEHSVEAKIAAPSTEQLLASLQQGQRNIQESLRTYRHECMSLANRNRPWPLSTVKDLAYYLGDASGEFGLTALRTYLDEPECIEVGMRFFFEKMTVAQISTRMSIDEITVISHLSTIAASIPIPIVQLPMKRNTLFSGETIRPKVRE